MDYTTNAPAGAAMLDMTDPEWFRKVSRKHLRMRGTNSCVMGQLHGDYRGGIEAVFGRHYRSVLAREYGFFLDDNGPEMSEEEAAAGWLTLTSEWSWLIGERLEKETTTCPQ